MVLVGAAISWVAMITYFTVVPRWADLRDSGLPSVALGIAGLLACALGLWRSFQERRHRVPGSIGTVLGILPVAFLGFYVYHLSYQLPAEARGPDPGRPAPEFQLRDQENRPRSLSEFRGRKVVLVFFRGHW